MNFPETISNIGIFNASHATTELPNALLLAIRSVHNKPDKVNIVSSLTYDDNSVLYIIICPAGIWRGKYMQAPLYYITYQLDPIIIFDDEPYRKLLSGAIYNWDYSRKSLEYCNGKYDFRMHYLPPGYVETLSLPDIINNTYIYTDEGKDIDVLFLGWDIHNRRKLIKDALTQSGLNVWFVCTLDINGMKQAIRRSKICINIHYVDDMKIFESIRMNILLSNQTCIISEDIDDPETKIYEDNIIFVSYHELIPKCVEMIYDPERRRTQAIKSHQWYRNNRYWNKIVDFNKLLPNL